MTKIQLIDHMGTDLRVTNCARVSFNRASVKFEEKDEKLLNYLAQHEHMSPFRHAMLCFRVEECPEVIARQWFKHIVGCSYTSGSAVYNDQPWNEVSGRYVEVPDEFYTPGFFRAQSASNKQASTDQAAPGIAQDEAQRLYTEACEQAYAVYRKLLEVGVCREQARMVLPLSMLTSFVWTTSLQAAVHFIKLRCHPGAQKEIRDCAEQVKVHVEKLFPVSLKVLLAEEK